jgi:hypothetical protein
MRIINEPTAALKPERASSSPLRVEEGRKSEEEEEDRFDL